MHTASTLKCGTTTTTKKTTDRQTNRTEIFVQHTENSNAHIQFYWNIYTCFSCSNFPRCIFEDNFINDNDAPLVIYLQQFQGRCHIDLF